MSLASRTREAVRAQPFLLTALRAGVLNYRAAAEFLDLDGDPESVATALRRFAEDLPAYETEARDAHVTMRSGVGLVDAAETEGADTAEEESLLEVGATAVAADAGSLTAVVATGGVDAAALGEVLDRLQAAGVAVEAAAVAVETLLVVVGRRAGAKTVRVVEAALEEVPT